jgi:hypothetical protein
MAEAALTRAVKIAQHQQTRTFELRAVLSLAKLYHSTDRPADAHAVLASALDGSSPTPEFPETAEAQTLLTALARHEPIEGALDFTLGTQRTCLAPQKSTAIGRIRDSGAA